MKREKAKELAEILMAYSEGKTIQIYIDGTVENRDRVKGWQDIENFDIDYFNKNDFFEQLPSFDYDISFKMNGLLRIKPQPKLVPFTFEDELLGRKIIYSDGTRAMITAQKKDGVYIGGSLNLTSYSSLISTTKFEDGSPCGKYINE